MKKSILTTVILSIAATFHAFAADTAPGAAGAAQEPVRKPIILIQRPSIVNSKLGEAWDKGLGRPDDQVSTAPGVPDDFVLLGSRKVGRHAWMVTRLADLEKHAEEAAKAVPDIRWVWYDLERGAGFGTARENKDPVSAVIACRKICGKHGWKLGIIPDAAIGMNKALAEKLAPHLDAFVVQCQKKQTPKQAAYLRGLAEALHKANPACLVGAQIGVGVPQRGYGPAEKAVNFYLRTCDFLDLYSVWWGTSESMEDLLRKLDVAAKNHKPGTVIPAPPDVENGKHETDGKIPAP